MSKIAYTSKNFGAAALEIIDKANTIIEEYEAQDFQLTLRQLYYQFVARDLLANTVQNYKRLGSIINDGRLAGMVDWESIEDRTREVKSVSHWATPADIIDVVSRSFRIDKWTDQKYRPEVWVEKEALAGVVERVCRQLDIPYLSCRGYTSQSEMWSSAMRLKAFAESGQKPVILHFGDHDPSGIDMSRDIEERLAIFGVDVDFRRLALNMTQVTRYNPPPNPAKTTDSRYADYRRKFGDESWELDALEPRILSALIESEVKKLQDDDKYTARQEEEGTGRERLKKVSERWDEVERLIDND